MVLRNMSQTTINAYLSNITKVSEILKKEPDEITELDLREYLLSRKDYSTSTKKVIVNSFKTFYTLVLDKDFNTKIIPNPIQEQKQPDILSVNEMQKLITSINNLKHKSIIALMYSAALRVSEVVSLKIKDIDAKNNRIVLKQAKGKKDRIVMLDKSMLELLRRYWNEYKTKEYLFEGQKGGKYSTRSIQNIVKNNCKKIKILKHISSHSLRHSSITQMIKDGVDLRTVQRIAGHKNINTTAGYIRIYDSEILETVSPLKKINL